MDNITPVLVQAQAPSANFDRPDLSLRTENDLGIAKLRVGIAEADDMFRRIAGLEPPARGRQVARQGLTFAWMGPGEWLVTGSDGDVAAWLAEANALGGDDALAVNLSHARVSFVLEGVGARNALVAHCPLDLWPQAFPVGAVARSLLGDIVVFIARLGDAGEAPRFRVIVDQMVAAHAARLLARA